jgi:UDP-N-acetylmuramoyl-tripeptide--D-alanyl-D-alanine ligase
VIPMSLARIAAVCGGRVHGEDTTFTHLATDSRDLGGSDSLFAALRGESADGHAYVGAAVAGGARAILAERPLAGLTVPVVEVADVWAALRALAAEVRAEVDPTTVAITGSVGKTTVKDLTAAAVAVGRRVHAARGSFNNELGVPLTLLGLEPTTEVLVAEVGARHVGDIRELAELVAPDVSVVTAVAAVHLEIFGTIEAIARTKGELVEALGPGGLAVLNVDDPRVRAMADRAPAVLRVGMSSADAEVTARDVTIDRLGRPRATVETPWGEVEVTVPIAGRHHLGNALLALAVAGHLGVDLGAAAAAIGDASVSPWRGEVHEVAGVTLFNDAYNANPTSVRAALETVAGIRRSGRAWAVLGVMAEIGETSEAEHLAVGRRCAELGLDRVLAVGPQAAAIAAGARQGGLGGEMVAELPDAAAATALLRGELAVGDLVLVKASRVAGLEQVASALLEELKGGASAPGEPRAGR